MLNRLFGAAMRRATELTRERKVHEATRAIQRLLTGREAAEPGNQASEQLLELQAAGGEPPTISEWRQQNAGSDNIGVADAPAAAHSAFRAKWPLDQSSKLAPKADLRSFLGGAPPLAKFRKAPLVPVPDGASYLRRAFACEAGARDYKLYIPSRTAGRKRPLIVMLHGCTQDPDDFAVGTGMNRLAEEHGFVVAYPWQAASGNHLSCWNWFDPNNQARDLGEPSIIAGITRTVISELGVDVNRVYVAGLSAGGAMAEILSATYPDLFAAAGIHSGLPYGSAADTASAFAAMSGTPLTDPAQWRAHPRRRKGRARTIVFHGTSDRKVHPSNGETILAEACAGFEHAAQKMHHRGSAGGRAYTRTVLVDAHGVPHVEHWAVEGLGHAWSGGDPEGSHTDRRGPKASREMLRFFLAGAVQPATE